MNVITIAGNIGRDGKLGQAGDYPVLNFPVASSKKIKGQEKTTWFDCALFGNRATALAQYIKKGGQVVVTGECSHEMYTKNDGSGDIGWVIKVNVSDVKLMGSKSDNSKPANYNQQPTAQKNQGAQQPRQNPQLQSGHNTNYTNQPNPANQQPAGRFEDFDQDIPFG